MDLNIAEISYETGEIRLRYARRLSPDGTRWIRHGLFTEFHRNGQMASQGIYENGLEEGSWHDFYESGQVAAQGMYSSGTEVGIWRYWNPDGIEEAPQNWGDGLIVE
mgnify:CR=1 FL=1